MSLIEVKNATIGYEGHVVLKNISFNVEENDFLCIVGPNGAGKSTLIKAILGLIKPMKGKIIYNDLKQNFIGYMPQDVSVDRNFPATVNEIVLSGTLNNLKFPAFYTKKEKEIADKNMKLLNIYKLKDKCFRDLSGGQRQKVLLARSLCATSKLLILDEPSNNLDSKSKRELLSIVKKLNVDSKVSVIMITHDLDHNNLIGNKILSLREDNIFFGSVQDFIRSVHEC